MSWTQEEIDTLKSMWLDGKSSNEISATLVRYSRNAVMGKVNRLGLMGKGKSSVSAKTQKPAIKPIRENIPTQEKKIEELVLSPSASEVPISLEPNKIVQLHEDGESWSEAEIETLTDMWLWGHHASAIADILPPYSKNSITGKATRLGLTGRQGERLKSQDDAPLLEYEPGAIEALMDEFLGAKYNSADPLQFHIAVMLAMLSTERNDDATIALVGESERAQKAMQAIETSQVWVKDTPPPSHWWHPAEGQGAMMLDGMAAIGIISQVGDGSSRTYGTNDYIKKNSRKAA